MALVLKTGRTYTDPMGNTHSAAYGVVDQNNGNKKSQTQHIWLDIYKDQTARDNGMMPIHRHKYSASGADWTTYFSVAAINADDNHYKQSYEYLLNMPELDPDGEPTGNLVWGDDWESDEA